METTATIERGRTRCRNGEGGGRWAGLSDLEPGLRRLLSTRCVDPNDVDDVIQETYLRAARYRGDTDDKRSLRAWTARIALNVLSDVRRRATRSQALPGQEEGEEAVLPPSLVTREEDDDVCLGSEVLASEDALALVAQALAELREADRVLLDRYYRDALAVPDCARALAIPARLVKVRLYRARRRLLSRTERLLAQRRAVALLGVGR